MQNTNGKEQEVEKELFEWVKANELPTETGFYICKKIGGVIVEVKFDKDRQLWLNFRGNVTHWLKPVALSHPTTTQLFYIEDVKELFSAYANKEITIGKLTELLNEKMHPTTTVLWRSYKDNPKKFGTYLCRFEQPITGIRGCEYLEFTEEGFMVEHFDYCKLEWLDESVAQPSTVLGWVDAEIELPKEGGRYWCYVEEINDLGIAHYQWNCGYHEIEKRWSIEAGNGEDKVTHWMPLLPSPNKTENPWLKVNGDDTQVNNVNYFAHVCEKHEWTASNTEPNYLVQCRLCGILKIKPNSTPTPTEK